MLRPCTVRRAHAHSNDSVILLGAWIFVSGIWDVPDEHLTELQHPFAVVLARLLSGL